MGFIKPQWLPNILSVFRALLIIPILISLLRGNDAFAFYLFLIAGLSDGLDGVLARRYQWMSRFGSIADPIADKLLLISTLVALTWQSSLPLWLLWSVVLRDVWVLAGATTYHFWIGRYDMAPSTVSKLNTFLQTMLVLMVLLQQSVMPSVSLLVSLLIVFVFITTIWSGIDYTCVWGYRAWCHASQKAVE